MLDNAIIPQPGHPQTDLQQVQVKVVPGNNMRCVIGRRLCHRILAVNEKTTSPLEQYDSEACAEEVRAALENLYDKVEAQPLLSKNIKKQTRHLLFHSCYKLWRAKFDLQEPCYLPPMRIKLKPGAQPSKIPRHYRWTDAQAAFLERHLVKLVNVGIISHTESEAMALSYSAAQEDRWDVVSMRGPRDAECGGSHGVGGSQSQGVITG